MAKLCNQEQEFRAFELKGGKYTEVEPVVMRNTLFGHLFGPEQACLVRVEKPAGDDYLERQQAKLLAISSLQKGHEGYYPFGSGNGAKQGKVWFADRHALSQAASWFRTAEEAASYGSVLFSENLHGVFDASGAKVQDHPDGADGQGYIDAAWLREQGLPVRQVQIRAAWPSTLAKGTMLPREGLQEQTGTAFLFHPSQLKGTSQSIDGPFLLGIRDIAQERTYRSSWTITQWLCEQTQTVAWERYGLQALENAAGSFLSNEAALQSLGAKNVDPDRDRTLLEQYLRAGLPLRHPWLKKKLFEHLRSAWVDAATGLGLPMKGGMAYYMSQLSDDEISCPWLPHGVQVVVTRYPVRDPWSFKVVTNKALSGTPQGSIGTNGNLQLDDDQDGDYLVVMKDDFIVDEVRRLQAEYPPRSPRPAKKRKASPLMGIARVMVEAMDGGCVGSPTWLIAGALNSGKTEFIPELSDQVQDAVESLKWHSSVDWELIRKIEDSVKLPEWLKLVKDRQEFTRHATRVEDEGLGRFWNLTAARFEGVMEGLTSHPAEFVDYVPAPDGRFLSEVEAVRVKYNRLIAEADGDMDRILKVIERLRAWADSKTEDRDEWAKTVWWAVHMSASAASTCSMAMHAFSEMFTSLVNSCTCPGG
jgi:hypothetical protein